MSTITSSDPTLVTGSKSKKGSKKKKGSAKTKSNGDTNAANGAKEHDAELDVEGVEAEEPDPPTENLTNGSPAHEKESANVADGGAETNDQNTHKRQKSTPPIGTLNLKDTDTKLDTNGSSQMMETTDMSGTDDGLGVLTNDRDSLRLEVERLRKSLEEAEEKHAEELSTVRTELEETQGEREQAESQYQTLLGKVNTIKSQLGERLKADRAELAQAREQMEELEDQHQELKKSNDSLGEEVARLKAEAEQKSKELSSVRNRTNLSQQNWAKEREDLISRETFAREEFETAKQAMQDWEILAMEERSIRENLSERLAECEDQLSQQKEAYETAASERDAQALTVDGLQRALQDIQDARKQELRELVQGNQSQVETLRQQLQEVEKSANESQSSLEATKKELERAISFEKEVKEKSLLIGKLRHEAVILNDHLTKALRFLKRGKPEDNIDRHIVTNHFLHFLALDRADPKKFQVLQLIAALLNWSDEQREQAGLARPGAANNSLRTPISPFHRTPSTPALNADFYANTATSKDSLAELWSGFLEQEAQQGTKSSRSPSVSSSAKPG